jgi:transposase
MAPVPATLPSTVEACHALIAERDRQLSERDALIAGMQHQLQQLLRARYGRRSEKMDDPNQLKLFEQILGAVWDAPPAEAEAEEGEEEAPRKRRRRGRKPFPAHLPRVRLEHDIPESEKVCAECGTQREKIGEETSEQLEYVPAHFEVKQHVRFKYACPQCEGQVQTAEKPMQPIEKGVPGPGLLAQVVVAKYCDHLPLYRQEAIFERSGVDICRETMWGWIKTLAVEVTPLYERMKAEVLSSHKIHTDDTPVRLRDARRGEKCESRIWTYVGDRAHPYTVFDYTANRRRDGPVAFLGDWQGYLQADAFSGYDCIFASRNVIEVACLAHARRKFEDALPTDKEVCDEALALIGRLYALERGWKELGDDERKVRRQGQSLPLLEKFKLWLEAARGRVLPKSPAGQAVRYALKNWQALCRYTEHGELEIDNNAAERTLRSVAVGRKNWLFFGSHVGGKAAAIFFSLIASAKRQGFDPFEYLRDVFERLPAHPASRIHEFLPDKWKELRARKAAASSAPAAAIVN